jgi:hypothetical protein
MKRTANSIPALALVLSTALAALSAGCASSPTPSSNEAWLRASPALRQQIEDQITRLPWTHGLERVEQIAWFARVGEPAYEALLKLCEDPRPDVAAAAVAALGATRDSRLVEPLRVVRWQAPDDRGLNFERARTFVRLGDWTQVKVLIEGLAADDAWARAWCLSALREVTGQDLGFDPQADAITREQSLERWRRWHASRTAEGILAKGG